MDTKTKREHYNRCNPAESLAPSDARNVDIDKDDPQQGNTGVGKPRGSNWVDMLATDIELSDQAVCEFFTGLPGSGKSTELRRLASRLAKPDGAHLLPVIIDAEDALDIFNTIDVPDILVAVLYATERRVLEQEQKDPEDALKEGFITRFWHWLTSTEVGLKGVEFTAGLKDVAAAKAVLEMKTQPSFKDQVRARVAANMTAFRKLVEEETKKLNKRATTLGYSGLIVILDSLEKLRGNSTNWVEVLASAERVFTGGAPYLKLPVHVVYTIPPALVLRLMVQVRFIPMLKLRDRQNGEPFRPGLEAARAIVRQRVPDAALTEIFGREFENRVTELIEWSGGYPREIVRLLQACISLAPLAEPMFRKVLVDAGDNYRRTVPEDALDWLARVTIDQRLPINAADPQQREVADLMLSNNIVLRYKNNEEWFDLHPALREAPQVQEAIARLKAERAKLVG